MVVLTAGVANRAAVADRLVEVMQANNPRGICSIKRVSEEDSRVPEHEEDWRFNIVATHTATETLGLRSTWDISARSDAEPDAP